MPICNVLAGLVKGAHGFIDINIGLLLESPVVCIPILHLNLRPVYIKRKKTQTQSDLSDTLYLTHCIIFTHLGEYWKHSDWVEKEKIKRLVWTGTERMGT